MGFWRRHRWEGVLVPVSGRRQLHPRAQGHRLSRVPTPARALGWGVPLGCPPRATGQLRPPLCPCWVAARDPGVGLIASWLVRTLPFPAWGPHSSSAPGPRPGLSQRETSSVAAEPPVPGGRCGAGARSDCGHIGAGVGGAQSLGPQELHLSEPAAAPERCVLHLGPAPSFVRQILTECLFADGDQGLETRAGQEEAAASAGEGGEQLCHGRCRPRGPRGAGRVALPLRGGATEGTREGPSPASPRTPATCWPWWQRVDVEPWGDGGFGLFSPQKIENQAE